MPSPALARDTFNAPIPILGIHKSHGFAVAVGSARTGADFDPTTTVITIYSTTACWIALGNASVTAAAPATAHDNADVHFIPAGIYVDLKINGSATPRLAAIRATADGNIYIWQRS